MPADADTAQLTCLLQYPALSASYKVTLGFRKIELRLRGV